MTLLQSLTITAMAGVMMMTTRRRLFCRLCTTISIRLTRTMNAMKITRMPVARARLMIRAPGQHNAVVASVAETVNPPNSTLQHGLVDPKHAGLCLPRHEARASREIEGRSSRKPSPSITTVIRSLLMIKHSDQLLLQLPHHLLHHRHPHRQRHRHRRRCSDRVMVSIQVYAARTHVGRPPAPVTVTVNLIIKCTVKETQRKIIVA